MDPSQQPQTPEPLKPPTPEELETRAKNIEAVKQLLTPEEWADVREAAYREQYAETALHFSKTLEELNRLRNSVGKLYGHFNNVMLKWRIPALTSYGKEQDRPVPGNAVVFPPPEPPAAQPLVKPKGKTVYRFDPEAQNLTPIPETLPTKKESAVPPAPAKPKKRASSRFPRTPAPKKETAWRRDLMEKQLKLRPSTADEIMSRLTADGFPVRKPYYAQIVEGRSPRIRTLVLADLYLLIRHKVLRREGPGRYAWVKGATATYKSFSNSSSK